MKILYEDESMLVCAKPPGVPVQTASVRVKDLTDEVRAHRQNGYAGVVHRLDQPVRGLVVFALNEASAADLSEQAGGQAGAAGSAGSRKKGSRSPAEKQHMEKTYLALVRAGQNTEAGSSRLLVHYLLRDPKTNSSRVVPKGTKNAKRAALEYTSAGIIEVGHGDRFLVPPMGHGDRFRVPLEDSQSAEPVGGTGNLSPCPISGTRNLSPCPAAREIFAQELEQAAANAAEGTILRYEVLCIRLLTGRHHQIRVQLAAEGMPVCGDRKYGAGREEWTGAPALCAWKLALCHPKTGERMHFQCSREDLLP